MVNSVEGQELVVKMRGLPWSATVDDILGFLSGCNVAGGSKGIHLTMSSTGRPSGECFVELATEEDVKSALAKDRANLGYRYVEVFRSNRSEMDWMVKRCGMDVETVMDEGCVRLRGLPFGSTNEDIIKFFAGLEINWNGITFATDNTGRATGEAYVQFVDKDTVEKALKKHKEKIGHRYIEIFRSSLQEMNAQSNLGPKRRSFAGSGRMAPYDRPDRFGGGGGPSRFGASAMSRARTFKEDPWEYDFRGRDYDDGPDLEPLYVIRMRGLPFQANEGDILNFFKPLEPTSIQILYEKSGRASGEALAEFGSHYEATRAMTKDREHMNNRYIELFMESEVPDAGFSRPPRGGMKGGFAGRSGGFRGGRGEPSGFMAKRYGDGF